MSRLQSLFVIKLLHTAVWALFAGCIAVIPWFCWVGDLRTATLLTVIVFFEVLVLVANGMRCPLTAVAGRYTGDRTDNFDIFLPLWLARYNKQIFGTWFALDLVAVVLLWRRQ